MNLKYFDDLKSALELEKQADKQQFDDLRKNASLQEKRIAGVIWYPVSIKSQELDAAEYLTVQFERHNFIELGHQFRTGGHVSLQTFKESYDDSEQILGAIQHVNDHSMRVKFRTEELPNWTRMGKLALNLQFDNHTYFQMSKAMDVAKTEQETNELISVLLGDKKASFAEMDYLDIGKNLNNQQKAAVKQIISANELAILHGPPGTGKTTTLVAAIAHLAKTNKILVTAPSNAAVDLLADKLMETGLEVLRIGNSAKVKESNVSNTLEGRMAIHPDTKEIKTLRKQMGDYKNMAHKYKRSFGKSERDQRKALFDEAHKIQKHIDSLQAYIMEDVLAKTNVTTATLMGSNQYHFQKNIYDIVVIDEAAQALEPACWVPILKSKKLVMAGDHFQLPPTLKSKTDTGLENTLFEKLIKLHPNASTMLEEQYRSNEKIMAFSSTYFYDNKLKAHASVAHQTYKNDDKPFLYIDTSGCGFNEVSEGTSYTNPDEAKFTLDILLDYLSNHSIDNEQSISIISPYRAQTIYIEELIKSYEFFKPYLKNIRINAVDSFQGQESDIVLISLVRSNDKGEIGFLADTRRMNVALTRARLKTIAIGDSATISQHNFYKQLVEHAENADAYQSAWEYQNLMPS